MYVCIGNKPCLPPHTRELWISRFCVYDALTPASTIFSTAIFENREVTPDTLIVYYPSATDAYPLAPSSSFDPSTLFANYS